MTSSGKRGASSDRRHFLIRITLAPNTTPAGIVLRPAWMGVGGVRTHAEQLIPDRVEQ